MQFVQVSLAVFSRQRNTIEPPPPQTHIHTTEPEMDMFCCGSCSVSAANAKAASDGIAIICNGR